MKNLLRSSINLLPLSVRQSIKHVPVLAGLQRLFVKSFLGGEAFVHTINAGPARGLRFEVTLPMDRAIWAGMFESQFSDAVSEAVRQGDVCYDIGGYRGYMSGVLAVAGASQVIVFEPLPQNHVAIERLAKLNPHLPLRIRNLAVGRTDGKALFRAMPDPSMGKLTSSSFQQNTEGIGEFSVEVRQLDSLVFGEGLPRPNLIKIDVEGAEVDVLDGAKRTLAECRPRVFVEAHSRSLSDTCQERLMSAGYQVRQLQTGTLQAEETRHLVAYPTQSSGR